MARVDKTHQKVENITERILNTIMTKKGEVAALELVYAELTKMIAKPDAKTTATEDDEDSEFSEEKLEALSKRVDADLEASRSAGGQFGYANSGSDLRDQSGTPGTA